MRLQGIGSVTEISDLQHGCLITGTLKELPIRCPRLLVPLLGVHLNLETSRMVDRFIYPVRINYDKVES